MLILYNFFSLFLDEDVTKLEDELEKLYMNDDDDEEEDED